MLGVNGPIKPENLGTDRWQDPFFSLKHSHIPHTYTFCKQPWYVDLLHWNMHNLASPPPIVLSTKQQVSKKCLLFKGTLAPQALKSIAKELQSLERSPPEDVQVIQGEQDLTEIQAWIRGPGKGCFIAAGCFVHI